MTDTVRLGVLGCGTVGAAVVRLLGEHADEIASRAGWMPTVARVGIRDPDRERNVGLHPELFTTDLLSVVSDPGVQIVVELMGGIEPARALMHEALRHGKHVVTANKALLANHGAELFEAAAGAGVQIAFEAAVGGGIPLVRPIRESLAGEQVARVMGIVNGTTNFILTRMSEDAMTFADALAEAQALGYAERDPADDVDGHDAAAKCAILATIAFDSNVTAADVFREGITGVTQEDIAFADRLGHVVKLLAVAELEDGEVAARVHPTMIPREHPLAAVRESFNAVFVEGDHVGELMFYGRGAGGDPTATAVVGDIVHVARELGATHVPLPPAVERRRGIRAMDRMEGQYYLCLDVADRPGVLAQVAGVFGDNMVSIKSVWQEGTGEEALLVLITHRANEGSMQATVTGLRGLEAVTEVRSMMRVEGEGG